MLGATQATSEVKRVDLDSATTDVTAAEAVVPPAAEEVEDLLPGGKERASTKRTKATAKRAKRKTKRKQVEL